LRLSVRSALIGLGCVALIAAWVFAATRLWQTSVPGDLTLPEADLGRYFSDSELERAATYQEFLRVDTVLASVAQLVALGVFAVKGGQFVRESAAGRIGTGMLLGMLGLGFVWLAQFPFAIAELWWQRRYGIANQGYLEWAVNDFLAAGGGFLFVSLALLIVMALAGIWRRRWWLAAIPALLAVALAFALVQPYLIPGLDELRDERVEGDARRLAASQGVPDTPVRVLDTRELTSAPNAGAAGIGPSRQVIVWDNLLERFPRPEVGVVLAHEFAHLSRDHIWKTVAWIALLAVPIALITELATRRHGGLYEPASVPLALLMVTLSLFALTPLVNAYSQRLESEADWVALETTADPDAATDLFRRFTDLALADPSPPGWADLVLETHPTISERIGMAEAWRARQGSGADRAHGP
jgi:STE24 endopeptidase